MERHTRPDATPRAPVSLARISHRQFFPPSQVTVAALFESTSATSRLLQCAIRFRPVTSRNVPVCSTARYGSTWSMRNPGYPNHLAGGRSCGVPIIGILVNRSGSPNPYSAQTHELADGPRYADSGPGRPPRCCKGSRTPPFWLASRSCIRQPFSS